MAASYDVIVVGAGHNGLVCATLLARAGRRVLVLEARAGVGGLAETREFAPGFRAPLAHLLHLMPAALIQELALERHGLAWAASALPTVALGEGGPITLRADGTSAGLDALNAAAYRDHCAQMQRFAGGLAGLLEAPAPRLDSARWADRWALVRHGWRLRRLGRADLRELLRVAPMNVYDLLGEQFTNARLQGALSVDAVLGSNFGPRSPGSAFTWLYRLAAQRLAGARGLALPVGGMGGLSAALASAARAAGAEVRTAMAVNRIVLSADRVAGVCTQDGSQFAAPQVVSGIDPKHTFLGLVGAAQLDTGFVRRVQHLRTRGLVAKLHLALAGLPSAPGVEEGALRARLIFAPSMDFVERAFNATKYRECSAEPALEVTLPSLLDPTLAPAGKHVLSANVLYAAPEGSEPTSAQRESIAQRALAQLERHLPGIGSRVLASEVLTPSDLASEYGVTGGCWHHAELALDQFAMLRPVIGAGHYATPIAGLYLCGAGAHPGGGVMGLAGRHAARAILQPMEAAA